MFQLLLFIPLVSVLQTAAAITTYSACPAAAVESTAPVITAYVAAPTSDIPDPAASATVYVIVGVVAPTAAISAAVVFVSAIMSVLLLLQLPFLRLLLPLLYY